MKKLRFGSRYLFVALEVNFINIKNKIVLQHILNFFFKDKLLKLLKDKKMDLKKIYSSTIFYPPIHLFIHSPMVPTHQWLTPSIPTQPKELTYLTQTRSTLNWTVTIKSKTLWAHFFNGFCFFNGPLIFRFP